MIRLFLILMVCLLPAIASAQPKIAPAYDMGYLAVENMGLNGKVNSLDGSPLVTQALCWRDGVDDDEVQFSFGSIDFNVTINATTKQRLFFGTNEDRILILRALRSGVDNAMQGADPLVPGSTKRGATDWSYYGGNGWELHNIETVDIGGGEAGVTVPGSVLKLGFGSNSSYPEQSWDSDSNYIVDAVDMIWIDRDNDNLPFLRWNSATMQYDTVDPILEEEFVPLDHLLNLINPGQSWNDHGLLWKRWTDCPEEETLLDPPNWPLGN